jgi:hypothetical protein
MISGRVGDIKYLSMFGILDEQSSLPKCTDITLVDAFHKQFATHSNYEKPRFGKESFIIKHFAGSVMFASSFFALLVYESHRAQVRVHGLPRQEPR